MDRLGIESSKTLTRWYQRGLIPKPELGTHPNGRGKMGYWEPWVLERCLRIRQLMAAGKELGEIADMLGSDWDAAAKVVRRKYVFADVSNKMDFQAGLESLRDLLWGLLNPFFRELGVAAVKSNHMNFKQLKTETLKQCVDLVRDGANPVVVYDGETFRAVPDFVIGQMLAKTAGQGQPWLIVPVYHVVQKLFGPLLKLTAEQPTMRPSSEVVLDDGDTMNRSDVVMVAPWDFEIKKRRKRKRE